MATDVSIECIVKVRWWAVTAVWLLGHIASLAVWVAERGVVVKHKR